ncbi:hypothetical protein, partial [Neisseria iguanae]|uniref:hypothetical protein n=1 Tax=Neisseria iguanae TaxID=90242 RepID=UPI0014763DE3
MTAAVKQAVAGPITRKYCPEQVCAPSKHKGIKPQHRHPAEDRKTAAAFTPAGAPFPNPGR